MPIIRLSRLLLRIAMSIALLLAILWAAVALWIDGPQSQLIRGALAAGVVVGAAFAAILLRPWWRASVSILLMFVIVLAWWLTLAPSNDRNWQPDVARMPTATIDGSELTIRNLRNFGYRSEHDFTERWETRTYDLDDLVGVDIFISFWGPTLYGHTITSWEFADGSHLAISIETRKEEGEGYSAVTGFFRQFELYYVVADERDLIALRTNHRGERVELYRLAASRERALALLNDYLKQMNGLAETPRWYNALTHNCTTTIWHHAKAVGSTFPLDWRLLANGYLIDLAYEQGSVDTRFPLAELKRRSDITEHARSAELDEGFSTRIRAGLPPRAKGG
jgi:hypothetical protein